MACAWHAIGTRAHADTGMYWTATIDLEYTESGEIYQYLTSLHWSVATFLGGNFEMYCRNSIERAVSIGYTMAGLVYGSILISLLSAALVDRNEARKLQTQRLVTLRRYLRERKIDQSIAVLVQQQITERLGKKEALSEKEVDSLGYLSKALRYELKLDMFRRHITTHPLFDLWAAIDKRALQSLCAETLDFQNILAKDDLFTVGAKAVAAYYVVKGLFHYAADATALASPSVVRKKTSLTMSSVEFDEAMGIESGAWLAEACLWVDWSHAGTAEAVQASQVLTVNGEGVCRAMAAHPHVRDITVQYCTFFHKAVTQARPPEDYPDDLRVPRAEFSSLVLRMDRDIQVTVGLHAIAKMKVNAGVGRFMILTGKDDKLDTLKNEVESGKSTLLVSATGEVERFVSLVAVRLVNKEKQLLVQLAKQENQQESIKADCALPAQKKPSGVSVEESLDRILADKLSQFTGGADAKTVVHDIPQPDVRIEESKLFGIKTKYLRYVCTVLVVEASHSPASRVATVRSTGTTDAIAAPLAVGRRGSRGSFGAQSEPGEDPLANGVEDGGVLRGLLDRNVHPVEADGKITWYAWVSEDEFAFLRRTEAKPLLLRWLASCSPSQAERPFDRDVSDVGSGVISPRTLAQRMMSPWHQAQAADQSPRGVGHTPAGASSAQTGASVPEGTTRGDGSHTTTPRHAPVHPSETRQAGSEEVTSEMSLAEEFHQEGHRPQAVL
ncbi:unnamed protein product [Prorocentrum cordatum]|uniref:Cyclic nucleotide-binding domain-containing protein n=1 Tax=Prorocentrum cordatum TaxID=2364126 RepID=A0ABN9PGL0_9DINO|nr:unnamed protein product [Polarella glacialis]